MPGDWNVCDGSGDERGMPCCYVEGELCEHLVIDDPGTGRRYACGLFLKHRDWDLVHADPDYQRTPKPTWVARGVEDCGFYWGPPRPVVAALPNQPTQTQVASNAMCCFKRAMATGTPKQRRDTTSIVGVMITRSKGQGA